MLRSPFVLASCVLCAASLAARGMAQSHPPNPPLEYRALVEAYRESGPAEVEQLLTIPRDLIGPAVDEAVAEQSGWSWDDLRGAAMLHTEVGVRMARSRDARNADFHLLSAQRLLARVTALSPPQEDFEWRWHFAVPAMLDELRAPGIAKRLYVYAAAKWKGRGGRTKYVRGIQLESRGNAGGRVLRPGESVLATGPEQLQSHWFVLAAEAFAGALRDEPKLGAAALHLGRIRMIQGQRSEATELLRRALDDVDPAVVYMAALLLGSLEERNDHFGEAETMYRRALSAFPYGQSAPIALAQLLSRTGRDAEAQATLVRRLTTTPRAIEPSWAYAAGPSVEGGTRVGLLRAETWK
jgi:hypothetical protein